MRKKIRCLKCHSLQTKRDGKRWVGKRKRYQKQVFSCLSCTKHFSIKSTTRKYGQTFKTKIFKDSLEGRSSMRIIARRKRLSKNTVSQVILKIGLSRNSRENRISVKGQPNISNSLAR